MDHAEAVRMFFAAAPVGVTVPGVVSDGGPARALRDALEPIAMHDVWSSRVGQACGARGHDFFSAYVTGRGAPLGEDAPPELIAATFAVFEPGFVGAAWDRGRALTPPRELLRLRETETGTSLHAILGDDPEIERVTGVLERAVDAVSGTGRPLFSALRAEPRLTDPAGRLWRVTDLVREHRGDGHVAAAVAAGLDPIRMGILAELWVGYRLGDYSGTRVWPEEMAAAGARRLVEQGLITSGDPGAALTEDGRRLRDAIEDATNSAQEDLVAAVGGDLGGILEPLRRWSAACIQAGAFPPDPRKRAAG